MLLVLRAWIMVLVDKIARHSWPLGDAGPGITPGGEPVGLAPSPRPGRFNRAHLRICPDRAHVWAAAPLPRHVIGQGLGYGGLLDWKDPATGKRVMALALRLEDAQIIGYWGEDSGDVICVFNHGMGWGAVAGGASVGPGKGALHGSQVPTYETELFTTMGMMILAGPGVRSDGYERDWKRWGLIREIDVAPTVSHLMGLRPPRHNQGVLPYDLLV